MEAGSIALAQVQMILVIECKGRIYKALVVGKEAFD